MDARVRETTLINRQYCWHGAYWSQYDAAAQGYDSPWGGEWAVQKEREEHYELAQPRGRVLDIGCGTGLFVDYCYGKIDRARYVGIDPSFGMLAKFRLKHPDYDAHATLQRTTFEDYETTLRFDTIVAMFGTASYVTRRRCLRQDTALARAWRQGDPDLLSGSGRVLRALRSGRGAPASLHPRRHNETR